MSCFSRYTSLRAMPVHFAHLHGARPSNITIRGGP